MLAASRHGIWLSSALKIGKILLLSESYLRNLKIYLSFKMLSRIREPSHSFPPKQLLLTDFFCLCKDDISVEIQANV